MQAVLLSISRLEFCLYMSYEPIGTFHARRLPSNYLTLCQSRSYTLRLESSGCAKPAFTRYATYLYACLFDRERQTFQVCSSARYPILYYARRVECCKEACCAMHFILVVSSFCRDELHRFADENPLERGQPSSRVAQATLASLCACDARQREKRLGGCDSPIHSHGCCAILSQGRIAGRDRTSFSGPRMGCWSTVVLELVFVDTVDEGRESYPHTALHFHTPAWSRSNGHTLLFHNCHACHFVSSCLTVHQKHLDLLGSLPSHRHSALCNTHVPQQLESLMRMRGPQATRWWCRTHDAYTLPYIYSSTSL